MIYSLPYRRCPICKATVSKLTQAGVCKRCYRAANNHIVVIIGTGRTVNK